MTLVTKLTETVNMLDTKEKIVRAAAALLEQGGREAVSTRAVAAAAGVQAPTIYRHFSDMRDLLGAVASYGFTNYFREKKVRRVSANPVAALRQGWDHHVAFGLANPSIYTLMYGDPRPDAVSEAESQAFGILHALLGRVAEAGRLKVGVEQAAQMIHAAACGVTLTLLRLKPERRDLSLSTMSREMVLETLTLPTDRDTTVSAAKDTRSKAISHAVALKALLSEATALTPGERALLAEWLDKLSRLEPSARHR